MTFSSAPSLTLCSSVVLSLPLTLCLLWLLANRFHMLLQLTSVLNYFTCDLRYFLRKSVRYLLKANKINLSCCHLHLSISCPFFFLSPRPRITSHTLLPCSQKLTCFYYYNFCFLNRLFSGDNFTSIHKKCYVSDSTQIGSVWAAGGLPLPLFPRHIDFILCSFFSSVL